LLSILIQLCQKTVWLSAQIYLSTGNMQ